MLFIHATLGFGPAILVKEAWEVIVLEGEDGDTLRFEVLKCPWNIKNRHDSTTNHSNIRSR